MQLPIELQQAIEAITSSWNPKSLKSARESISADYRKGASSHQAFSDPAQLYSYLLTRLPATYAACYAVFKAIAERLPDFSCTSLLDLGAGPGTASWAASQIFPLSILHLIERESSAIQIGKQLNPSPSWLWQKASLDDPFELPKVDLAVLSYVLAEMPHSTIIDRLWAHQVPLIAVIEPGTPKGFERIRALREHMLKKGAHLVAPCPHLQQCPMPSNDWCHFSARVERTKLHRYLKEGSLGYEDEKYSYVVFAHPSLEIGSIQGRIVRHPQKGTGHVKLALCANDGCLKQIVVTRSDKEKYRDARDAKWGDAWM